MGEDEPDPNFGTLKVSPLFYLSDGKSALRPCRGAPFTSQRGLLAQIVRPEECSELVDPCYENILETYGDRPLLPVTGEVDSRPRRGLRLWIGFQGHENGA